MSGKNRQGAPRTPVEAVIQRRAIEEERRIHHSWRAKAKFAGAALFGGLAAAGAVLMGAGVLEVSTAVEAAVEGVSTASAAGLFGSGLVELRQVDDASRHSSRMVQALAQQELAEGRFIGPGASEGIPEEAPGTHAPGNGGQNGPDYPGGHGDGARLPEPPAHTVTSQWIAQER